MGDRTGISWTNATWNPLRGCTRVSPGCQHCYAETIAARFSGPGQPYEGLATIVNGHARWTNTIRLVPALLDQPLRWKRPRMIFVNSMSDLFHPDVPDVYIDRVFGVMAVAPCHTFQILTKRAERMQHYCAQCRATPLPNVWLGVSVESQEYADERIPWLLQTPAAVRFLSCEPLLGPVDLQKLHTPWRQPGMATPREVYPLSGVMAMPDCDWGVGTIGWVIAGAESGKGARPMDQAWVRTLKDQCVAAGISFFYKQNALNGRKIHRPVLDGRVWEQFPKEKP